MALTTNEKREITRHTNEQLESTIAETTAPVPITTLGRVFDLIFPHTEEHEYALAAYQRFIDQARNGSVEYELTGVDTGECISLKRTAPAPVPSNGELVRIAMTEEMSDTRCDTVNIIVRNVQLNLDGKVRPNSVARWVRHYLIDDIKAPFLACGNGTYRLT